VLRYGYQAAEFLAFSGITNIDQIDRQALQKWIAHLVQAKQLAPTTVRSYTSGVQAFCTWCQDNNPISHHPGHRLELPKG
jgi:site-specific recombinase XerD